MKFCYTIKVMLLIIFVLSVQAYSQGIIRGTVRDAATGEKLVGANVYLIGTSLGSSTSIEGEYKITQVPEGKHKVRVSYIGYKTIDYPVTVINDQSLVLNAELKLDVIEGQEIIITGQALGQASAINQQKNSNTIVNVLSEEKIQSLPDANAAEAIGRMPGVSIVRSGGEASKIVLRGMSDRFSFVTIDGIRMSSTDADSRSMDLSTISQGSLAGIELFKALTPDKDADAIAGSVNLVTRKAPDQRLLRFDAKGAYNKLRNTTDQYDFQLRYGERFFDNILGVQFTGNLEKRDRSNEQDSINYTTQTNGLTGTQPVHEMQDFFLNYARETRKRQGLSLLLDINTPDDGSIRISNVFNGINKDNINYERHYPTVGSANSNAGGVPYSVREKESEIKTYNSSIRGENNFFDLKFHWGVSFAQSMGKTPYDYELQFSEPTNIQIQGNDTVYISGFRPVPDNVIRGSEPGAIIPYHVNSFENALSSYSWYRNQKNLEKEKTAYLDVSGNYNIGDMFTGEFKTGGKYRYKNRFKESVEYDGQEYLNPLARYFDYTTVGSVGTNGAVRVHIPALAGTRFEYMTLNAGKPTVTNFMAYPYEGRNVFDQYNLYPLIDPDAIREWYRLTKNGSPTNPKEAVYLKNYSAEVDYYDIIERLSSAYVMNTLNYGQFLTFIAGLRVEQEQNGYKSKGILESAVGGFNQSPVVTPITASHTETIWLPNFHVTARPTDYMNVRLAAYKALARPDYLMRLNRYVFDQSSSPPTINAGNPNLVAAQAWNFEANASVFSNDIGLITVSAFYKNVKKMYHTLTGANEVGDTLFKYFGSSWTLPSNQRGTTNNLTFPYNSDRDTKVWGFEFEHQARFGYLPGLLQNIVLSYNFSFMKSETFVLDTKKDSLKQITIRTVRGKIDTVITYKPVTGMYERKDKLEGQPEFFGNVSIGYDIYGISARVSYFYQKRYAISYSANGFSDQIQDGYGRLDFSLKYEYNKNLSFFLNLNNLTDTVEKTYRLNRIDNWEVPTSSQRYGLTGDLGVRVGL